MGFSLKNIFGGGGGGSTPKYNVKPLQDILNQGADKQRGIATSLPGQLTPIDTTFGNKQGAAGADYLQNVKQTGTDYVNSIANPQLRDKSIAAINENAYRNVPAAQQAIRESLAGTGRFGNGKAQNLLAQPVVQAGEQAADNSIAYDNQADQNRINATGQAFGANTSALASKLGLDSDTAKTLMENGRGDLIQQAQNLLGIEGDVSQGLFNLEDTRQKSDIASAQADQQRRSALLNSLLGIGGQVGAAYLTKGMSTMRPQPTANV